MKKFEIPGRHILTIVAFLLIAAMANTALAIDHTWTGGTSSDWSLPANWSPATVPAATDNVFIGTATFTAQPTVTASVSCAALTFGFSKNITFSVNATLTVNGDVTQTHTSNNTSIVTTIQGTGVLSCINFNVGDNTNPPTPTVSALLLGIANVTNTTTVNVSVANFAVSTNLALNSTSKSASLTLAFIGTFPTSNVNNPILNLNTGNLSVGSTIVTSNSAYVNTAGFSIAGLGVFPSATNTVKLTVNPAGNAAANTPTLYLAGAAALNISATGSAVDFNGTGSGSGLVVYSGTTQVVYTNTTTNLDNSPQTYQNLLLNGSGVKTTNSGTLTVGNGFTSTTTSVLFNTNNTTVSVGNSWINSSAVTQGSGNITIGNAVTNNAGGVLGLGTGNFYIAGNYTNNLGGTYTQSTGTTYFNGASQTLQDLSAAGTIFNKVVFNNSATATMVAGSGNFSVSTSGILTMVSPAILAAGSATAAYLTLLSGATSTATVAAISGSSKITGLVNAQRYLSGGSTTDASGKYIYRNYRLMSSPVNTVTANSGSTTVYPYLLKYMANSAIVTGAIGGYAAPSTFDSPVAYGNPTIYFYREDRTPSNVTFTSGNFIGAVDISKPSQTLMSDGTNAYVSVGNGFMFFFRGDRIHFVGTPGANKTTYPFVPVESTVFTATGFLNQGTYQVQNWVTGGGSIKYETNPGAGIDNSTIRGYNLVGNPYASSINWDTFSDGSNGITSANVSPTIYTFNPLTSQYNTYMAGDGGIGKGMNGTPNGSSNANIIASGQGFFVKATNTPATLTFTEQAKVSAVAAMTSLAAKPAAQTQMQYMRLAMVKDSLNYDDMLLKFKPAASRKYNVMEDAEYLSGINAKETLSSISADNIRLAINTLPLPSLKDPLVINLNIGASETGLYTFKRGELQAVPELYEIWLMDNYAKDSLDIRHNTTYGFNIDKNDTNSYGANRFKIVIRQNNALAFHLLSFTAGKTAGGAQLKWNTENEQNYTAFAVQRSTDNGTTFTDLGGFTSNAQGAYSFLDSQPALAADQYRIKITDLNGTIYYTCVATLMYADLSNNKVVSNVSIYPNPAVGAINLSINTGNVANAYSSVASVPIKSDAAATANATYDIRIMNITGNIVKTAQSAQPEWHDNVSNLLPGTYIVQVSNSNSNSVVGKTTFIKL